MSLRMTFVMCLGFLGCDGVGGSGEGTGTAGNENEAAGTCTPVGLEDARAYSQVDLPAGCSFHNGGRSVPTLVQDPETLEAHLTCSGANAELDLGANELYLVSYSQSPAFAGVQILDDGARATLVTRSRAPCPSEYPPMPSPELTIGFLLPRGTARSFAVAGCNLPQPPNCP